ncbi:F0F1 ATP synthase subunit A [Lichenifustis flavocetrariae]|uniref:ATP synthase subunit a n=1 Tax=Lichenifustis flavocetrariae TaxID=2949735 RepID=A0AA41YU97_9HYPH|nr:F0F1 ATP synthase subunit A [Lichenifustis flavocetrariae]MCW6507147.1 F0F1 ATP synthase subunit A [Lichenifustis flavocetrariae]
MPENAIDPIHQFNIERIFNFHPLGLDASFTNASLLMLIILGLVSLLMIIGTSQRSMVPGRLQSAAEMSYEFVANTVRGTAGDAGMKFMPLVFSLFMFVFFANVLGLLPFSYTVTSQIVVTFALAALVMAVVIIYGIAKHGTHFLNLFAPSGVSPIILPFIVLIEVISFVARPISLSVRLFANMLAGHITLKVFGGFIVLLLGGGFATALLAPLPFLGIVILTAFELLVAVLQAYVFAILTCVYLNDAIHPGH